MIRTVLRFLGDVLDVAGMAVLVALIMLVFWIMDLLPGHQSAYHRRGGYLRPRRVRGEKVA